MYKRTKSNNLSRWHFSSTQGNIARHRGTMYMNSPTVVRQKKATFSPGSRIFYYCQLLVPQWEDSKTTTTKISALQYVSKNVLNKTKLKHLCSEIHITKTTAHKKNYKRSTDCLILQLHKDLIYPFSCKPSKASWAPPPCLLSTPFQVDPNSYCTFPRQQQRANRYEN